MAFPESRVNRRMSVAATVLATTALAVTSMGVAADGHQTSLGSNESDESPKAAVHAIVDYLSLIHISEPTRLDLASRMPSSA